MTEDTVIEEDAVNEKVKDIVSTILKAIARNPKEVNVEIDSEGTERRVVVQADPEDYPRFIGKRGVIVDSIRKIIFSVAAENKCKWVIIIPESENSQK